MSNKLREENKKLRENKGTLQNMIDQLKQETRTNQQRNREENFKNASKPENSTISQLEQQPKFNYFPGVNSTMAGLQRTVPGF